MRHGKKTEKLSRIKSHREAMLSNMATSLFMHQRIKTTQAKAKALAPLVEKLVTRAKTKSLHAYRQVYRTIRDRKAIKKLFEEIAPQLEKRSGGYTRILKLGLRKGDGAKLALIELLIERPSPQKAKGKKHQADKKGTAAAKEKGRKKDVSKKEEEQSKEDKQQSK